MSKTTYIILTTCLLALVSGAIVQDITEGQLSQIQTSKKIWLVYGSQDVNEKNLEVLHDVGQILTGFFKIGILPESDGVLRLYGDDASVHEYKGKFDVDSIVQFVLSQTNSIIEARSKIAKQVKANKQFLEKQAQRAEKQWKDQQQLRKKSDVIVLTQKTWETTFIKQREPYLINFYEANCSACIDLNKEWEAVATALKGKAKVAKLNITEAQRLQSQIKLSSYPSIRYYSVGTKKVDTFEQFLGIKKKFSILQWANSKLSEKKSSVQIPALNKNNYNTICKQSKNTCVILFVEDPQSVSAKVGQLAAKHVKKPISFLVSKKGSQPNFEKEVGVQSNEDTVFMYCKQKKLFRVGSLDYAVIQDTINQIANGNRNNFVKYKFEERFN